MNQGHTRTGGRPAPSPLNASMLIRDGQCPPSVVADVVIRVAEAVMHTPGRGHLSRWTSLSLQGLELQPSSQGTVVVDRFEPEPASQMVELATRAVRVAALACLAVDLLLGAELPRPDFRDAADLERWSDEAMDFVEAVVLGDEDVDDYALDMLSACPGLASLFADDPRAGARNHVISDESRLLSLLRRCFVATSGRALDVASLTDELIVLRARLGGPFLEDQVAAIAQPLLTASR